MADIEQQDTLRAVTSFHARRLSEMAIYEITLSEVLALNERGARKDELSHMRLLKQPISYQVLALIWQASPFSVGLSDWTGWETEDTVYSLSKRLMPSTAQDADGGVEDRKISEKERQKLANYITRVVQAGEFYELIQREPGEGNRRLLRGTALLHELMYEFARYGLNDEYFRNRYDG